MLLGTTREVRYGYEIKVFNHDWGTIETFLACTPNSKKRNLCAKPYRLSFKFKSINIRKGKFIIKDIQLYDNNVLIYSLDQPIIDEIGKTGYSFFSIPGSHYWNYGTKEVRFKYRIETVRHVFTGTEAEEVEDILEGEHEGIIETDFIDRKVRWITEFLGQF